MKKKYNQRLSAALNSSPTLSLTWLVDQCQARGARIHILKTCPCAWSCLALPSTEFTHISRNNFMHLISLNFCRHETISWKTNKANPSINKQPNQLANQSSKQAIFTKSSDVSLIEDYELFKCSFVNMLYIILQQNNKFILGDIWQEMFQYKNNTMFTICTLKKKKHTISSLSEQLATTD